MVAHYYDVKGIPMSDEMKAGTVKFFNTTKGFGFVQPDDGGDDVFVHITALQSSGIQGLNEGDKVTFNTAVNQRTGKTAVETINMA
jgi:CspA family cold shock protein